MFKKKKILKAIFLLIIIQHSELNSDKKIIHNHNLRICDLKPNLGIILILDHHLKWKVILQYETTLLMFLVGFRVQEKM